MTVEWIGWCVHCRSRSSRRSRPCADDFALRKGNVYGRLVDIATGKAIDLLDGSEAEPLAQWLRDHPGPR